MAFANETERKIIGKNFNSNDQGFWKGRWVMIMGCVLFCFCFLIQRSEHVSKFEPKD